MTTLVRVAERADDVVGAMGHTLAEKTPAQAVAGVDSHVAGRASQRLAPRRDDGFRASGRGHTLLAAHPAIGGPMSLPLRTIASLIALSAATAACAADQQIALPRVIGQALVGTSGFEPGVAAEWTIAGEHPLRLRPELLLQDGDRPGIGGAVLWQIPFQLPEQHDFFLGPRLVYHNGEHHDDPKGEIDAMGIYTFPIIPSQPGHHHIQVIVALGILDKDGAELGASAGAAYAYSF